MICKNSWYKFYKLAFRNKLDLFSKKIAREVFEALLKGNNLRGKFQHIINSDKENELADYGVKEIAFTIDLYAISFSVSGHYLSDQKTIVVNVALNPKMLLKNKISSEHYENIIQEVKYTIRHELEHAYYNKLNDYSEPSYKIPSNISSYKQYVLLAEKYLLDPSEIDSYIRELMLKAKNKRVEIDSLLVDMIYKKVMEIAPETIKKEIDLQTDDGIFYKDIIGKILRAYRSRINSIYQKR